MEWWRPSGWCALGMERAIPDLDRPLVFRFVSAGDALEFLIVDYPDRITLDDQVETVRAGRDRAARTALKIVPLAGGGTGDEMQRAIHQDGEERP